MRKSTAESIGIWTARHALIVWIGIVLNLLLILPLLFDPVWLLGLFGIPINQTLWVRFSGLLLLIISIFYIPATIDLERYRVIAWLAVFPARSFGSVFFFLAVFVFDQPPGFIVGILLDGVIGLMTLICLIKVTELERRQESLGMGTFGGGA